MKQGSIRKRLVLAAVMGGIALGVIIHDRYVLDYRPGPSVAGIKLPDAPAAGRTLIGIKVPQRDGGNDIIAI